MLLTDLIIHSTIHMCFNLFIEETQGKTKKKSIEATSSWWTIFRRGAGWYQPSRGRELGCPGGPQPVQPRERGHATPPLPHPFQCPPWLSKETMGLKSEMRPKNPQKCCLFLEECLFHVAHSSARESRKPLACGQLWPPPPPPIWFPGTHPSSSCLLPRPGDKVSSSSVVSGLRLQGSCPVQVSLAYSWIIKSRS